MPRSRATAGIATSLDIKAPTAEAPRRLIEQAHKASKNQKKEKHDDCADVILPATEDYALMAIEEDEIDDLAMLATKEVEDDREQWIYQETEDGAIKAACKSTGLTPDPLSLLVKEIDTKQ
jgi:hypothetical protein